LRVLWTEAASEDLEAIYAYIGTENPKAAVRQVLLVVDTVEKLLPGHPASGRPGRVPNTRELVVPDTPFIAVYRVKNKAIQILRVLHGAMQWPDKF
jgi:toxin ParE1/3/4